MPVDIGAEAIDRSDDSGKEWTLINKDKPAEVSGIITSIDIWAVYADITGLRVGTFYTTNGNSLRCRASEAIAGSIPFGSKVTKGVSIAVEIGDYIGCYFADGWIKRSASAYSGLWIKVGEHIDPNDEAAYTLQGGDTISLGGYISPAGWAGGDVLGVDKATVGKINGVALADIGAINDV